ncbi:MAG TPA: DNA methylase, partial [Microbacteriaceae bacterium]|nr:DNA methylase [Microbacteriaceae bacterium]
MTGYLTAADLGIDVTHADADALFRWFLASLLFGRPIRQQVAADTWRVLISHGLTSPDRFADYDREGLRALLDEGHYARIDYVMTDELHNAMATVRREYGSVSAMVKTSGSRKELTERLEALVGVGPKTAEIFLREVPDA